MGRQADYSKKDRVQTPNQIYERAKSKYGKESMSAVEFAAYISGPPESGESSVTDKSVKNYIQAICDRSKGRLSPNDFRNQKNAYEFLPEYHALLWVLMKTGYFDGRKNDRRISTRAELYRQLINNIDLLPNADKKNIQSNPTYINAELEGKISRHIEEELTLLLRGLYHADVVERYKQMANFLELLSAFRKELYKQNDHAIAARMVYAHELDELQDANYQKGVFEAATLDDFLIQYLALKLHNEEYRYIDEDEKEVSIPAIALALKAYNLSLKDEDIAKKVDWLWAVIENQERYNTLWKQVSSVLNENDPLEADLLNTIERHMKIQFLRPYVEPEEYNRIVRFIERCIAEDNWDLINKFIQLGRRSYTKQQISAIRKEINKNEDS